MRKIAIAFLCVIAFSSLFACQKAKEEVTAPAVSQSAPAQPESEQATAQNPSDTAQQETSAPQNAPAEGKKAE